MSAIVCSQCGKEIKKSTRETYYSGIRGGETYALHPECRAQWLDDWARLGNETRKQIYEGGRWMF